MIQHVQGCFWVSAKRTSSHGELCHGGHAVAENGRGNLKVAARMLYDTGGD